MAGPLAALERFFERVFERPAALLFRTRLQPVQVQRRLERAMESQRQHGADRTYVPNRYRVRLHPDDLAGFQSYQATLETQLAEALLSRARSRGYTVVERPRVTFHEDPRTGRGEAEVDAEVLDPLVFRPAPAGFRRVADPADLPAGSLVGQESLPVAQQRVDQTSVFQVPKARSGQIVLLIKSPGRAEEQLAMPAGMLRIGRSSDNDLVLGDTKVSRYHAQLTARQGALVFTDLGSSNGSQVGGARVSEMALGPGDVIRIGDSTITIANAG
ncbi:MAG: DUF3662 domain-containing protein [Chloroflexi bacterium]|nr:DUF3662 domain-containing protein [Chloroflexota bacterium]